MKCTKIQEPNLSPARLMHFMVDRTEDKMRRQQKQAEREKKMMELIQENS